MSKHLDDPAVREHIAEMRECGTDRHVPVIEPDATPDDVRDVLAARGPRTARQLRYDLHVSKQSLTRTLRRLCDAGEITRKRDPADGRVFRYHLDASGEPTSPAGGPSETEEPMLMPPGSVTESTRRGPNGASHQ